MKKKKFKRVKKVSLNEDFYEMFLDNLGFVYLTPYMRKILVKVEAGRQGLNRKWVNQLIRNGK
jgi:hypothetical protein